MTLAATRAPRRGATSMAGMMVLCRYSLPEPMMPSTSMATQQTEPSLSIWSVLAAVPRAAVLFLPATAASTATLITLDADRQGEGDEIGPGWRRACAARRG